MSGKFLLFTGVSFGHDIIKTLLYCCTFLYCFLLKGHLSSHAYHAPNGIVFCKILSLYCLKVYIKKTVVFAVNSIV